MSDRPSPSPTMSEAAADAQLATNRQNPDALVCKADHRLLAEDHRAASAYYRAAQQALNQSGRGSGWLAMQIATTIEWLHQRYMDHIVASLAEAGFQQPDWHPRFAKSLAMMFGKAERPAETRAYPQIPMSFFYADMSYCEFAPREQFEWAEALEAQTASIKREAKKLLQDNQAFNAYVKSAKDRPQGDVHGMLGNVGWSSFELASKGAFDPKQTALCPVTHAALKELPLCQIANRAPTPMFSLLRAGETIPPHTGMINVRYVCHLPLIVPGDGALRVGSTSQEWREGQLMMFDDSVEHEAYNRASTDRLVLIFDVWRPELEMVEREQLNAMFEAVDSY